MTIYALRVDEDRSGQMYESLIRGEGRFGWSYVETANLYELRDRIERDGWNSLNSEEQDCYQEFLLSLDCGDYVVYINVPEWSQCTLARVTGRYFWRWEDDDFNHRFPVDPDSVYSFGRNDAMVAPVLSARLKLMGRYWRIYVEEEFGGLVEALRQGVAPTPRTPGDNLRYLKDGIKPVLSTVAEQIQHTHPNTDLESLAERVFRRVPGVRSVIRQGGAGDRGADLIVELEFGTVTELVQTLVVQVKSYQGILDDLGAVNDIRRAFDAYDADAGLIVSTATSASHAVQDELDRLREGSRRPVALLIGDDLAAFFLRYGFELLLE